MKLLGALLAVSLTCASALPCTGFLVVGNGRVLFGNNEDYWNPETRVWFVPEEGERHGVMYLGFDNGFPQGGMNAAGLAFDGFATSPKPMTRQKGKRSFRGNPISEAMETCATVEEVVAFLGEVDLSKQLTGAMLFFGDASGDSVIIEGDEFIRKEGEFQAITNFYQSEQDDDLAQCPRYAAAVRILEGREETSLEVCERALSASAQRGRKVASLYSNVFDLKSRTAHIYLLYDFEHAVVLDLAEELEKGARTLRLPDLFPPNAAFEEYAAYLEMSLEERIAARRGPALSAEELEPFEGDYVVQVEGRDFEITFRRKRDTLVATSPMFKQAGGKVVFHSTAADEFFMLNEIGELGAKFHRDQGAAVTGFTLQLGGSNSEAIRFIAK
jgi:hypothetical protein